MRSSRDHALLGALPDCPLLLAVSGGRDSMALLHAVTSQRDAHVAAVATFDHATGAAATRAADLVAARALTYRLPLVRGRAERAGRSEAALREARWSFLRAAAAARGATIVTAHTRDDQVETVLMRALRGAGARGLAGLYAPSNVRRPLLDRTRTEVAAYVRRHRLPWVEDPSNASRRWLRNRVRLDLLPALMRADPDLDTALLACARRAAALRADVDQFLNQAVGTHVDGGALRVARADLAHYDAAGLALLWPALAARLGLALDRRGTARLAAFTIQGRNGRRIQLSGRWQAALHHGEILLARIPEHTTDSGERVLEAELELGRWRFRQVTGPATDLWSATLPSDGALRVRAWRAGDRMTPVGASAPRRVKRMLREAGIAAHRRSGWPVVLMEGEIVWVPGVRRSPAASAQSGRTVSTYRCERSDD